MNILSVQNLGMIITENCNLNCAHCLRGKCTNKVMSDDVIVATLDQIDHIHNLAICGGEPTLALDRIEKIFSYVVEKKILVDMVTLIINGTIYSEDFLKLLDYIDAYIKDREKGAFYRKFIPPKSAATFNISWDKFHYAEVERLGIKDKYHETIDRYAKSKHFYALQGLKEQLFREGNAESLDPSWTKEMSPMQSYITYATRWRTYNKETGVCHIGPIITINVNGTITECDASIEHQETQYNYGNVLTDRLEDIYAKKAILVLKPRLWLRNVNKELEKYRA